MNYKLQVAASNPYKERLENVIEQLLRFIETEAVYVSNKDDNTRFFITFILKSNTDQDTEMISEIANKIIKEYPDFVFRFVDSAWAAYGFKKCKPYFIQHCTLKELVYLEANGAVFYPNKNVAAKQIRKAKKRFQLDIEAAIVSFRNVPVFLRNRQNTEAAFALHQTLRYIYICASEFLTPQFISSNCLLEHYDYIIDFAPSLKRIADKDTDREIFEMLNSAYNSVAQNQIADAVDVVLIARAQTKVELIQKEINRLFAAYVALCKEKIRALSRQKFLGKSIINDKVRSNYIIDAVLNKISDTITNVFKIRSIYCFGYATIHDSDKGARANYSPNLPGYHFYLLIVNLEPIENVLIQNLIRGKFDGKYKVTVLSHTSYCVRKKNKNQSYFFDKIIANGLLVYNNPLYLIYTRNTFIERDAAFSRKYVSNRIMIAQQLFSLAQNCFNNDSATIKKVLYRKTIEQVSIALIYLYLGYYSSKYSINYLFSLLKYTKEVELPFDFTKENEKLLYKFMTEKTESLKQNDLQNVILEYNKLLEQKSIAFLEYGTRLADNKFEKLEKEGS
jgi:hypothetical protein